MTKKSTEKTLKNRTIPAEKENTGRLHALQKCQKREASESIEMTEKNRPTPANDDQPGRGQALRDWFSSSFGRKASGIDSCFSWFGFTCRLS